MGLSIYDFTDYRAFLEAWLSEKKSRSMRGLAMRLEISPSQISMVRSGRRNLNLEHARHWAWGMRLDPNETDHWEAMVRAEHGPTERSRRMAERQLQAARAWQNAAKRSRAFEAYSEWYGTAIKQMVLLPDFEPTGEWIGPRLRPAISPEEAERCLALLIEAGALVKLDDGTVTEAHADGSTGVQVGDQAISAALVRIHKAWLEAGKEVLSLHSSERYLARLVLRLDQARLDEVVEVLRRLHIEAAEAASEHEPTHVYEIGMAVIPRSGEPDPS